jgi:periplasmic protein TonB
MRTVSLRSVALSLTFHGVLLGAAARAPEVAPPRPSASVEAALEAAIAVDTAASNDAPLPGSASAAPADPEPTLLRPSQPLRKSPAPIAAPLLRPALRSAAPQPEPRARPPRGSPSVTTSPTAMLPAPPAAEGFAPALPAPAAVRPPAPTGTSEAGWAGPDGRTAPEGREAGSRGGVGTGTGGRGTTERSTGDGHAQLLASYLKGVRDRVSRHREYPYLARRANLEGTVCLRVVLASSGRVLGVTPTCGGSHQPLVEAALASVSSAAPFPPLPPALGQRLTIDVPVVFALEQL